MRWIVAVGVGLAANVAAAAPIAIRCEDVSTADLAVDGLLDDWGKTVLHRQGTRGDGLVALRCAWDGSALALALEVEDDRVVRLPRGGHDDHVKIAVAAGGKPVAFDVYPGNALAKSKITKPAKGLAADSLQKKGYSVEALVPAGALAGFSGSTPALALEIVVVDSDQATGGDTTEIAIVATVELGDRKDLLDDFLRTTRLRRSDVKVDVLADLDPDRKGKERIVAGGTVIGVLTDQYAFVQLPVKTAADVKKVELLQLGAKIKVVAATVRQSGNGGSRDLLMLWTVWTGQLQPLAQIEIRKELGGNVLEASWKLVKGKKGPELHVEPRPAIGFTAETWNEVPADDADPILLPWDTARGGIAYTLRGAEVARRDLPPPRKKRKR